MQRQILDAIAGWGYVGSMVSVFCIDAAFCIDASKFISGALLSLSAMIALELPQVTILTKCDLIPDEEIDRILDYGSATHLYNAEHERHSLVADRGADTPHNISEADIQQLDRLERRRIQRHRLTDSICRLLDDWQLVSFLPLNLRDEDSIDHVFAVINHCIQHGEDAEVKGADRNDDPPDADNDE